MQNPNDNAEPNQTPALQEDAAISPLLVFDIFWRRRYSVLLTATVLGLLSVAAAMHRQPAFVATASVLMQERKSSMTEQPTTWGAIATDLVAVRTQADILHSPDLARQVVRAFHLADMPEFSPHPNLWTWLLGAFNAVDPFGIMDRLDLADALASAPLTPAAREEYPRSAPCSTTRISSTTAGPM